MIGFLLAQILH